MTRISGEVILRTPCCGALMRAPRYASLNFMAWEYWTDGYADHGLAPQTQGLRMCACGRAYLMQQTTKVIDLPPAPQEETQEELSTNWLSRLFTLTWSQSKNSQIAAPEQQELAKQRELARAMRESFKDVPAHQYVHPEQLPGILETHDYSESLQVSARRLYWWYLNMPHREYFRAFREVNRTQWPAFKPSEDQQINMRSLLDLLLRNQQADQLEISELHRELGQFEAAQEALQKYAHQDDGRARAIAQLLDLKLSTPARFRHQNQ